jgi:hypothetical protein
MGDTMVRKFAERLRNDPMYLACVLRRHRDLEHLTDAAIAHRLGISDEMLARLELCKTPDPDSEDFAEKVRAISDFTLADEVVLAEIIRRYYAIEAFDSARDQMTLPSAARDRDSEQNERSDDEEPSE